MGAVLESECRQRSTKITIKAQQWAEFSVYSIIPGYLAFHNPQSASNGIQLPSTNSAIHTAKQVHMT